MDIKELMTKLENWMPKKYFETWDNNGLIIGDESSKINNIMLCMDINDKILDYALEKNVDTIISHHPMIFSSVKQFNLSDSRTKLIFKAYENKLNILSYHTAYDIAEGGTHDYLAQIFELQDIDVLETIYKETYYQIQIYVPSTHEQNILSAIAKNGAGKLGDYDSCSFSFGGIGRFKPLENATPFIGNISEIAEVEEVKIEAIVKETDLNRVILAMKQVHPYEEVAYNVFKLENLATNRGHGRLGFIEPITFEQLCHKTKKVLDIEYLKAYGDMSKEIKCIAIAAGSGEDFIKYLNSKVDVFITGDLKTNKVLELIDKDICVIDAGHYETERPCIENFQMQLKNRLPELNIILSPRELDNTTKHTII